ncbi:MAG: hypothetical protein EOP84_32630 [Verrucomicrobiaceae bacterium]|nr:MAG: hypothetical protein EOP84_32630 [Verrucomicrobiaceae bacterium]
MENRLLVSAALVAVIALIAGVAFYLSIPVAPEVQAPIVSASIAPAAVHAGTEGSMVTVTTPPKTFNGRLSPEATSIEEFSSNPKRDPEEQQVLDLAAEKALTDQAKVQRLLAMIPTLPPDAQTLAMENATALIPDAEYGTYRHRLLELAKTPEMREAVMDDTLTRGEELRLPNLLELMRTSTSDEEKQEIREVFEAYLDKDYGPHPSQWEIPVRKWVAENSGN